MKKRKNTILILLAIIAIVTTIILIEYESSKQLKGAEKRIYNIFKEEEKSVSTNFESFSETTEISVMSYNIHRGKDFEDKYTIEEIINYLKESDADIICLQEVLFAHHTLIRESGGYKSQYVANIDIPIASTGVATYSKYPIIESNHIVLSSKTEQRGALHTVYKINDKLVNVINLHLGLDKKEREKQLREIEEYCSNLEGEVIIAGDFNQKPVEIEGFRDIGKYHGYDNRETFFPLESRIDYIFMTTKNMYSSTYNILYSKLSDHYPIMAKIKYKPEKIEEDDDTTFEEKWLNIFKKKRKY